jgi:sulfane dehydrogenase subunit SoxC
VLSKCLTRFNLHWVWDGKPALIQQPRHGRHRLRAAHLPAAARRARHALDLSQQQPSRSWLVQDSGEVKNVQLS